MTTEIQSEALRLADISDTYGNYRPQWDKEASAELRRLHARVKELESELAIQKLPMKSNHYAISLK